MCKPLKVELSYDEFLKRLKQEYEYHKDSGTDYRQKTARFSTILAEKVKNVTPFLNAAQSKELVHKEFPKLDMHRKDDIAKMLRVIAKSMYLECSTSNEVTEYATNKINKARTKKLLLKASKINKK